MCDELDGRAARAFNQTSTLGALLDMVTDRVATTGLLALLCAAYPRCSLVFLLLLGLDISSHWFQMYASLLAVRATTRGALPRGVGRWPPQGGDAAARSCHSPASPPDPPLSPGRSPPPPRT